MSSGNNVTVTGNATREPELRFTPSGAGVASFGVAVNRRWPDKQGEWQEETSFFDVTAWGSLAENLAESVPKGTRVTVTGRLEQQTWETPEGDKRSKVQIVADDVAVSLRWATAEVHRKSKDGSGSSPRGDRGYDPDREPF